MMKSERLSDSGSSSGDEVTPADAAAAAELVARFAVPLQAARELQVKEKKKSPVMSQEEILAWLNEGGSEFQNMNRNFAKLPAPVVEEITSQSDPRWQSPGVVSLLVNKNTQHLKLKLTPVYGCKTRWTVEDLERLCTDIGTQCKDSLRSLVIENPVWPRDGFPGLSMAQLSALLQQLHGLTELSLRGKFEPHEIDSLITVLASSSPDIKHLSVPCLSTEGLNEIADSWPDLEVLQVQYEALFKDSDLSAVLTQLPNLRELDIKDREKQTEAMLDVALKSAVGCTYTHASYKLTGSVDCSLLDCYVCASSFFSAFPAVDVLQLDYNCNIPAVCAGLQAHPLVSITSLSVCGVPLPALEHLLAVVGRTLKEIEIEAIGSEMEKRVDLNIIGQNCPKLESLVILVGTLVAGDQHHPSLPFFTQLRRCALYRDEEPTKGLPDSLVHCLLASPHLERFLADVPISEAVAASVIAACGEHGALSSLTSLGLHLGNVSAEVVAALVSHAPRLLELKINSNDQEEFQRNVKMGGVLSCFLKLSGLQCEYVLGDILEMD